jgi:predicted metal-dependent HD superfamily phosphohydrolase
MLEEVKWREAWGRLGVTPPPAPLLAELTARYAEPHRAYHTAQHLRECFSALEPASFLAEDLAAVELGLWFHDAIYDPRAHDNEEQSARWAQSALVAAGVPAEIAARVQDLVLATKHSTMPDSPDARLLVDVDLSILGAPDARFAEYEAQIRHEYAWVPEDTFRQRRARVLASFLERPAIYSTPHFARALEQRARVNLARSLRQLGSPAV